MKQFYPGCKIQAKYPKASDWLAEKVLEFGFADEVTGCCRTNHQLLKSDDVAVAICNNCMAMIDEDAANEVLENIWVLIDKTPDFPLPDYGGKTLGLQDCGRAYDRADVQDAIRSIMAKMNINIVELPDAREKSVFCGSSALMPAPTQDAGFAPKRYVQDAAARGMFVDHPEEERERLLKVHAERIPVDEVACYCTACDAGLAAGGKKPVNLIELVSGCFIER